jgi:hypothetical protein
LRVVRRQQSCRTHTDARAEQSDVTEEQWLTCTDPTAMLEVLRTSGKANDRKLRLFAVACERHIGHLFEDKRAWKTLEFAERFADGLATKEELHGRAWGHPGDAGHVVAWKAWDAAEDAARFSSARAGRAAVDKETYIVWDAVVDKAIFAGHHLREAAAIADKSVSPAWVARRDSAELAEQESQCRLLRDIFGNPFGSLHAFDAAWRTPEVLSFAQRAYDARDFSEIAELAASLSEAGCADAAILGHLRGPGPHVRGCWVVDLILGKA